MKHYRIDIKLPIGLEVKFEYKQEFEGLVKSLLLTVLDDLESRSTSNYNYFIKKRISDKERNRMIEILRLIDEKHHESKEITLEQYSSCSTNFKQPFQRYLNV